MQKESTLHAACPFPPCEARPRILPARLVSGDAPTFLYAQHITTPDSWFGMCPASLQPYPPDKPLMQVLAVQSRAYDRMRTDRPAPVRKGKRPPNHSKEPNPDPDGSSWFDGGSNAPNNGR